MWEEVLSWAYVRAVSSCAYVWCSVMLGLCGGSEKVGLCGAGLSWAYVGGSEKVRLIFWR